MKDVTKLVDFRNNDDEALPLTKCVCGAVFEEWSQIIGIYSEHPWVCPVCSARLIFSLGITVHQLCDTPKPESESTESRS